MEKSNFYISIFILGVLLMTSGAVSTAQITQNPSASSQLQKEMDVLLKWFPGEYDNHQQVYKEAVENLPTEKRHRQTHHIFHEVQLEFIPGRTLYAQQSQHYDLNNIYRQRIYAFSIDEAEQAIRLRIYTPKNPEKLTNGHLKPEVFANLRQEDFFLKPGCDVFWKFDGQVFNGYLKENACSYYSDRFTTQVYLNETLTLRKDALLLEDTAKDSDGNPVFGVHEKGPTVNLKVPACK